MGWDQMGKGQRYKVFGREPEAKPSRSRRRSIPELGRGDGEEAGLFMGRGFIW